MENNFQSIDTSIPHQGFNPTEAESNLKHLQDHVFNRHGHVTPHWSPQTGMSEIQSLTSLFNRQDSVPEEALFGPGTEDHKSDTRSPPVSSPTVGGLPNFGVLDVNLGSFHSNKTESDKSSSESSSVKSTSSVELEIARTSSGEEVECVVRSRKPHDAADKRKKFRISSGNMEGAEGEQEEATKACKIGMSMMSEQPRSYDEHERKKLEQESGRRGRSDSTQSAGQDDGYDDVFMEGTSTLSKPPARPKERRSSSLPDLVLDSSGSSSASGSRGGTSSPDVTFSKEQHDIAQGNAKADVAQGRNVEQRNITQRNAQAEFIQEPNKEQQGITTAEQDPSKTSVCEQTEVLEGPSSIVKRQDGGQNNKKKLFIRTVSFHEETSRRVFDEEGTKDGEEKVPLKNDTEDSVATCSLPTTPVTPEEKRIRYSVSSGYVTGSDGGGSREEANSKGSVDSQSSAVWSSTESASGNNGSVEFSDNVLNLLNMEANQIVDPQYETKSFGSNRSTGSSLGSGSGSSVHTVINSDPSSSSVKTEVDMQTGSNSRTIEGESSEPVGGACANHPRDNNLPMLSILQDDPAMMFGPLTEKPAVSAVVNEDIPRGPPSHNQPASYTVSNRSSQSTLTLSVSQLVAVAREEEKMRQTVIHKMTGAEAGPGKPSLSPAQFSLAAGQPSSHVSEGGRENETDCDPQDDGSGGGAGGGKPSLSPAPFSLAAGQPSSHQQPKSLKEFMLMRLDDMVKNEQMSPTSLQRLLNLYVSISDGSTPSPSPMNTQRQLSPDLLSFSKTDLERASRCTDRGCEEMCCVKKCDIERLLQQDIPEVDPSWPLLDAYCGALWQHSQDCEELECHVRYCDHINKWSRLFRNIPMCGDAGIVKRMVGEIQRLLVEPVRSTLTQEAETVIKLRDELPNKVKADFETSMLALSQLGEFGSDLLCYDETTGSVYVQQTYPLFEAGHQLAMYQRLRNLEHPNIVNQLWLLPCEETTCIKVYTAFLPGGSLQEYLSLRGGGLPWSLTVHYMRQILAAVMHLHAIGVVYLYWHSGNMVFPDCSRQVIQITGFGYSYPKNCDSDLGATKQCLPYNLCPPELLRDNCIDDQSDVWGAGCLMAEMYTGRPVWHRERHEDRDAVHNNIRHNFPKVDTQTTAQMRAFEICWQTQPGRRKSIKDLHDHLSATEQPVGVS